MVKTQNPKHISPRPDQMFRALADPTRLAILHLLRQSGERCVCDIVDHLRVPQPTASRHLAYLRRAGLVDARREGQWMHYRLTDARTALHRRLIECIDCCGGMCGVSAARQIRASSCC